MALLFLLIGQGCDNRPTQTPVPSPTPNAAATQPNQPSTTPASVSTLPTDSSSPTAIAPNLPSGTILLWHSWAQRDGDVLRSLLTDFHASYPDVTVETLFVAHTDLLSAYAQAVQAGEGPDVLLAPNWWLGDLVTLGVLRPLDAVIATDQLDRYWPAAVDSLRWQDQIYGLPVYVNTVSLYTNRSLLSSDMTPPVYTADFLDLAQQNPTLGTGIYNSLFHIYWGMPAYGADLFDDGYRVVFDSSSAGVDYLNWLAELDNLEGSYVDQDYGMLLDRFKKGEFAFFVDGLWSASELLAALGPDLAVSQLPSGPAGPGRPWLYTEGFFLNPRTPPDGLELSLLLANHLSSTQSANRLADEGGLLPANRQATASDPILQGFISQLAVADAMPIVREMDQVWGVGGDMFVQAVETESDPAVLLSETATLINEANGK